MEYPQFKVCVCCFTYNQSKYIADAMNGFCMQQTDFPYVCCIVDDASTDGEQDVICKYIDEHFNLSDNTIAYKKETEYAHIIFAQHNKKKNCYFSVCLLKENHHGKKSKAPYLSEWRSICEYEALCEGDDYWIDSRKLQNQVNLLDSNPNYALVFSRAEVLNINNLPILFTTISDGDRVFSANEIFRNWIIPTGSILYRLSTNNISISHPEWVMFGDIILFLKACRIGEIFGMQAKTSVYRINEGGITQGYEQNRKNDIRRPEHYMCIKENFGDMLDSQYLDYLICLTLANRAAIKRLKNGGIQDFRQALRINPTAALYRFIRSSVRELVYSLSHH